MSDCEAAVAKELERKLTDYEKRQILGPCELGFTAEQIAAALFEGWLGNVKRYVRDLTPSEIALARAMFKQGLSFHKAVEKIEAGRGAGIKPK